MLSARNNNLLSLRLAAQRTIVGTEYNLRNAELQSEGKTLVYPNQKETAMECVSHFESGKQVVMLVAQPGTGKTGVSQEVMYLLACHADDNMCVSTKDMMILTGMSDNDWQEQYENNMLPPFKSNIYHRGKLLKQVSKLSDMRNGLITTDECHIASDTDMIVSKTIKNAGLLNLTELRERGIRMLDISATPESVLNDISTWGDSAAKVYLKPGPTYKGFEVMLSEDRIRKAPVFTCEDDVREFLELFEARYNNTSKKYFPIRLSSKPKLVGEWLQLVCNNMGWVLKHHDSEQRVSDIDQIMRSAPTAHTIILVKGFWRASKRIVRTHVGGTYEFIPSRQNVTTAAQGLCARFCDNYEYSGDELNPDLRPIHFGDIDSIHDYLHWINSGCNFESANYQSTRITAKDGHVVAHKSKFHATNVVGITGVDEYVDEPERNVELPYVVVEGVFNTEQEARTWCTRNIPSQYIDPKGDPKPYTSSICGLYTMDSAGLMVKCSNRNQSAATHYKLRGDIEIRDEASTRSNVSSVVASWNGSARGIPVRHTDGSIKYIIVHRRHFG